MVGSLLSRDAVISCCLWSPHGCYHGNATTIALLSSTGGGEKVYPGITYSILQWKWCNPVKGCRYVRGGSCLVFCAVKYPTMCNLMLKYLSHYLRLLQELFVPEKKGVGVWPYLGLKVFQGRKCVCRSPISSLTRDIYCPWSVCPCQTPAGPASTEGSWSATNVVRSTVAWDATSP